MHSLSLLEFNLALSFITEEYAMSLTFQNSLCTFPTDFRAVEAFCLLTDNAESTYSPKTSNDLWFHNPALCYIHRYLAYNFSGRRDALAIVSKTELFFLWCIYTGRPVNLGYWFALQFEHVIKAKRPLILGSLITQLLFSLHGSNVHISDLHVACQADPLDARCLDSMGLLLGTPSSFRFVPLSVRSTPSERVFRQQNQNDAPAPVQSQPTLTIEQ
ncbi:hypothetical protein J1N35_008290 [Gossypium stocksii]|uniref:Uncharacterized protein n=1 Tax=Gossypium stocksii TaxID=47602 RepID=A0A9D4AE86_9ROSI|nr:hypothetical protein J1N35_008290 [Gossypium stocksii]